MNTCVSLGINERKHSDTGGYVEKFRMAYSSEKTNA
jgi:hypothetical protein